MFSSPAVYRSNQQVRRNLQAGTLSSFTVIKHTPADFSETERIIGLIQLADGRQVVAPLDVMDIKYITIGQKVVPRLRLNVVNKQGLRVYDAVYEVCDKQEYNEPKQKTLGYILALTGPVGVGRNSLSAILCKILDRAEKVVLLTTQPGEKRKNTKVVQKSVFADLLKTKNLVAAEINGQWFGYKKSDIQKIWEKGKIPVVVTDVALLRALAAEFGRQTVLSFGLLPPGNNKRKMLSVLYSRLSKAEYYSEKLVMSYVKQADNVLKTMKEDSSLLDHTLVNDNLDNLASDISKILGQWLNKEAV